MFRRDIIKFDENDNLIIEKSIIKTTDTISGVLLLENKKTYGRDSNTKRFIYKSIPYEK